VTAVAFSGDSKKLLTAGEDGTALVWLTEKLPPPPTPRALALTPAECWELLAGDGAAALRASAALAAQGDEAVALLKAKLAPVPPPAPGKLPALLKDLDSAQFAVRNRAMRDLESLGDVAEEALRTALEKPPSAEAGRRLKALLDRLETPPAVRARVRQGRAVAVLEQVGSPAAVALLEALAAGAPTARLTHEARAALHRLRAP
jgi:hypothetical protein